MTAIVYGASDDLLEVRGEVVEEFSNDQDDGRWVALSNGVLLRVTHDGEFWRVRSIPAGHPAVTIIAARGEDEPDDADGCPGYSDKAVVRGGITWVAVADDVARAAHR